MLSLYKIRVDFGKSSKRAKQPAEQAKGDTPRRLASQAADSAPFDAADPFDVALLRWAQADVVDEYPFARAAELIASETGDPAVTEQRVLERLQAWKADGTLRRFGAFVHHRKLG